MYGNGSWGGRANGRMSDKGFDVAVIGAGPAGAVGAVLLTRKNRRVVVIERQTRKDDDPAGRWLSCRAVDMLEEIGVKKKSLDAIPFNDVTFHTGDFSKSANPAFDGPAGYLTTRGHLRAALMDAITAAGAELITEAQARDLHLGESTLKIELSDDQRVESRLLLLATGKASRLLDRCGLGRRSSGRHVYTSQIDAPLDSAVKEPRVGVVLGLDRAGSFGQFYLRGKQATVSVNWLGDVSDAVKSLINLCKMGFEHKVLPIDLSREAASAVVVPSPAGLALDIDTHVGKHTLLVGDAGGFVAAASNEGVYPAMWSAQIAVEVLESALTNVYSQDELMSFDAQWRMTMADYLRSPNTDIQFLLPLIFSNQAMADRMGAAFFFGENI